jgi:hypothetical protein
VDLELEFGASGLFTVSVECRYLSTKGGETTFWSHFSLVSICKDSDERVEEKKHGKGGYFE